MSEVMENQVTDIVEGFVVGEKIEDGAVEAFKNAGLDVIDVAPTNDDASCGKVAVAITGLIGLAAGAGYTVWRILKKKRKRNEEIIEDQNNEIGALYEENNELRKALEDNGIDVESILTKTTEDQK